MRREITIHCRLMVRRLMKVNEELFGTVPMVIVLGGAILMKIFFLTGMFLYFKREKMQRKSHEEALDAK